MPRVRRGSRASLFLLLGGGLLIALLIANSFGAVSISIPDIVRMTLNKVPWLNLPFTWSGSDETIIFQIRLPRVIGGATVGAALATAGVIFQGLLRNPMADPYIIGTSAGAALGATIAMMAPLGVTFGFGLVPVAAFAGALLTVLLVYNLAQLGGKAPIISMLLAGFVVSALLMAVTAFFLSVSERLNMNPRAVYFFLMGNISVAGWTQLIIIVPLVAAGIVAARFYAFNLNAFSLGEESAAGLGIEVERDKRVLLGVGSLLTAAAVSISGVIGFVGLVVPHAIRLVLGPDHRLLLPAAALAGACLVVIADLLARLILAPIEIPVGIITALIGGPFFIYLLRHNRREYAF